MKKENRFSNEGGKSGKWRPHPFVFIYWVAACLGALSCGQAIGQTIIPTPTKITIKNLSEMSDEQWVKKMEGPFNAMKFFNDKEELAILKANVQLTGEQMDSFQKCYAAFAKVQYAAKETSFEENNLTDNQKENLAEERVKKAEVKRLQQAKEFRKVLGTKDIDVMEWLIEGGYIFGTVTLAQEEGQKNGNPDPEKSSNEILKDIKKSDFYNEYVLGKTPSFKSQTDFGMFFLKHESQIRNRVVCETCGQIIRSGGSGNKELLKVLIPKRKKALQELLSP